VSDLHGRHALVTGAGRGIGAGAALALARAGASMTLVARTRSDLERVVSEVEAAGGRAYAHPADLLSEEEATAAVSAAAGHGDLSICVNAAGTNRPGPARDYATEDWDALFALNVRATFLVCRSVGDDLIRRGRSGSIVNLSSQMGTVGYPGRAAYCATKHAVEGLTKALGVEWARDGVRVNAVAPTFVETPMTKAWLSDPGFRSEVMDRIPMGQLATVDDVGAAIVYLAGDGAARVTGSVLRIDGGWTAW
jgi:NAD(P)-dependent dehydrogenase (short-subunit alcohol dehydrogenase family)